MQVRTTHMTIHSLLPREWRFCCQPSLKTLLLYSRFWTISECNDHWLTVWVAH